MKNFIATIALVIAAPALGESFDVGVAGEDYEMLVTPDSISVFEDATKVAKYCGHGTHGCAILGKSPADANGERKTVCHIFIKARYDDLEEKEITLRHEMKHCYGWAREEMPKHIKRRGFAQQSYWLEKNHKKWQSLEDAHLDRLK